MRSDREHMISRKRAYGRGRGPVLRGQPLGARQPASTRNDRQNCPERRSILLRFRFLRSQLPLAHPGLADGQRFSKQNLNPKRRPTMNIQMIPLNRLIPSPANVRKTGTHVGIDELAASIAAHGLLQNLQVRPGKGGKFEVVAGGRRLAALKLLAKQKVIAKTAEIGCNVLDGENAGEISLAENIIRLPMHPADQFDAFHDLSKKGMGPEEIAGRFGCTPAVVRQRLKLASVSPRLMDIYRAGDMNLDQLMAFTVSDDHAAQEAAWFDQPPHNHHPSTIRRILTAAQVEGNDRLAVFVGADAYVAAGGIINRDLFQPGHEGYFTDAALLNRLATEKLQGVAEGIRAEGWAWVEIMPDLDYATLRTFGRVDAEQQPLSAEQEAELERLTASYDALIEEHGEDPEPEIADQLETLSEQIDALSSGSLVWQPDDMARSGAIVSIGHDGAVEIERGRIRPEDRQDKSTASSAARGQDDPKPTRDASALPERLIEDLTAHRTAALRAVLADEPCVALAAVTHALALAIFYDDHSGSGSCLDLRVHSPDLRGSADGIADSRAAASLDERHAAWSRRLPQDAEQLWVWLLHQTPDMLTGLLACCAAFTLTAVRKPKEPVDAHRLLHADRLAATLDLDMRQWWQPTAASYFGRVAKARMLEAVAEAVSKGAADNLVNLKKDALAARAEEKVAGTGWLPSVLRPVSAAEAVLTGASPEPVEAIAEAA